MTPRWTWRSRANPLVADERPRRRWASRRRCRAELATLITRATALETTIQEGFGADAPTLDVDEGLLADLPADVVASFEPGATPSTLRVPVTYGVWDEIMRGVSDRAVRERLWRLLQDRGRADNTLRMADLFRLRRSIAQLAGFESWATLRTSVMAFASPEAAGDALDALATAAHPVTRDYIAAAEAALGDEIVGGYQLWDQFRGQAALARGVGVDVAAFRRYLPMDGVAAGLFDLVREVFGIRVEERPERLGWHDDVRTLALYDDATGEQIGVCLWDPFERDGKMAGAIAFMEMLEADVPGADGRRPPVVTMLVTTFPEAADGAPQRLSLDEVDSLFHEFGHVLDYTIGSRVAGSLDESWWGSDFAEGPSFFLAAWSRKPAVLERFAVDPATGEGIPKDAVAMLRVGQAIEDISFLERYIAIGRLDLAVHGPVEVDLDEAWRAAWADNPIPEPLGGFRPFPFSLVAGGYDAAVYGIPYALAVRDELLGAFESAGWLDPGRRAALCRAAPRAGPFVSAFARLESFLGRPPDSATLLHHLESGIAVAAAASLPSTQSLRLAQRLDHRRDLRQVVAELMIAPGYQMDPRLRDHAGVEVDMRWRNGLVLEPVEQVHGHAVGQPCTEVARHLELVVGPSAVAHERRGEQHDRRESRRDGCSAIARRRSVPPTEWPTTVASSASVASSWRIAGPPCQIGVSSSGIRG